MHEPITFEFLQKYVKYDPETGVFTQANPRGRAPIGAEVGSLSPQGYRNLSPGGRAVSAHRAAWLMMTGEWPKGDIDHINRNKADNRWTNLRNVSRSENKLNQHRQKNNETGCTGVSFVHRRWAARVKVQGKVIFLGSYDTKVEAIAARRGAERALKIPQATP